MGNRTFERASARRLYDQFSRAWRRDKRLAGKYGRQGYRKPTFAQWYEIHQRDHEMMAQSTPQDVQEYLGIDPWAEPEAAGGIPKPTEPARGVMTIPIAGDAEEE